MRTLPAVDRWSLAADGTPGPALRRCLEAAIAAPSIHNTQPWRFRVRGTTIDVFADRSRRLAVIDPRGRELLISVGAALLNLRVAILAHGRLPLTRLLPSPDEPDLAAQVVPGPPHPVDETVRQLARAIPKRHTNRRPFADVSIGAAVLAELASAARAEGARLTMADGAGRDAVLSLARTAEHRWLAQPRYWVELAEWTLATTGRNDGIPPEAFGPWSAAEAIPLRDFGLIQAARRRDTVHFEPSPTIAVLYAAGDGPAAWLHAGQALERVLLTATVRGLSSTPMTQPLEVPELRSLLADDRSGMTAHAVLRLGFGPPCAASPRRPLAEVVTPGR